MPRLARLLDRLIGLVCLLGAGVGAGLLLLSLGLVSWSVGMRYFLGRPTPWVDEAVGYMLVGLVMAAAADALRRGEHIAVDLLPQRLGPRGRRAVEALGQAAVLAAGLALLKGGLDTVAFTRMLGIRSTGYLDMPMHLPQAMIPLGGGLLALAAAGGLLRMALGGAAATGDGAH